MVVVNLLWFNPYGHSFFDYLFFSFFGIHASIPCTATFKILVREAAPEHDFINITDRKTFLRMLFSLLYGTKVKLGPYNICVRGCIHENSLRVVNPLITMYRVSWVFSYKGTDDTKYYLFTI